MWSKLRDIKDLDRDDVLALLGLERKRGAADWILPAIGFFGVGMLVGAGLGLMLAPKSGLELREDIRARLQGGPDQMAGGFPAPSPVPERTKAI
ncbi:MAG: YtxH domain-containing protein [Myxococcales bacterium]|nr:YtxH domain-containing protein [Myxococcales bacterium]